MESRLILWPFSFSKWRLGSFRGVFLVLILALFLPCSCSNDSKSTRSAHQSTVYHMANINVSYNDLKTQKEVFKYYEGYYGVQSLISGVSGVVMHAVSVSNKTGTSPSVTNNFGCTNYSNIMFPTGNWIALVERGDCSFATKIRIAKEYNATAVLIYNNVSLASESEPTLMEHDQAPASIAVLLSKENGKELVGILEKGYIVFIQMTKGRSGVLTPQGQTTISKTSVLFVSISFIVLMIVSLAWLVFYYIQRFRYSHAKEILARRLACAAKKAIAKIPQRTLKLGDKELDSDCDQCAVCIEPYKFHDVIRILPCRHIFHKSCVDPWLLDQRSCPMCKLDILRAYGMQIGGSHESLHQEAEASHVTAVRQEEPEVSSSTDDGPTDSVKVALVPTTCIHLCHTGDIECRKQTLENLPGAVGGAVLGITTCTNSLNCTVIKLSRAGKSDKADCANSEMRALISKGRRMNEEACIDEDEEEKDCETAMKDSFCVTENTDPDYKLPLQPS